MNISKILTGLVSLMLIMIGLDKFLNFMEPPCSLMESIPSSVWMILGVIQLAGAVLLWFPKYKKITAGFFVLFMLTFTIIHLINGTYDIGGSAFMAVLMEVLFWNPEFIQGKSV